MNSNRNRYEKKCQNEELFNICDFDFCALRFFELQIIHECL